MGKEILAQVIPSKNVSINLYFTEYCLALVQIRNIAVHISTKDTVYADVLFSIIYNQL